MRFWLFILCFLALPAFASELSLRDFSALPIQHEGRIKPMDSAARAELRQITGRESWHGQSAIAWLAQSIFVPEEAIEEPLFRITTKGLREQLGLPERDDKTYSTAEVLAALQAHQDWLAPLAQSDRKSLTQDQRAALHLVEQSSRYLDLISSMKWAMPLAASADGKTSFYRMQQRQPDFEIRLRNLAQRKGQDLNRYTEDEIRRVELGMRMAQLRSAATTSSLLRVMPPAANDNAWAAPWAVVLGDAKAEGDLLPVWEAAVMAYRQGDAAAWQESLRNLTAAAGTHPTIAVEMFYQAAKPMLWAEGLYAAAAALFLLVAWPRAASFCRRTAPLAMLAAALSQSLAIGCRIFILARPPVGTLYETLLFVSLIVGIIGLVLWWRNRSTGYPATAAIIAMLLLSLSPSLNSGDSLEVLVAVLDTNFWLATHVICITAAYGVCIAAAGLAHLILLQQAWRPSDFHGQSLLLHRLSVIALFLTACGTVLGGVWADQSWGRFWGWDPKENGALLIVLWLAWVLHGRMAGRFQGIHFVAASAALGIIVAVSWFGVNLLSTGLHSYGFIEGMALGLGLFCLFECLCIAGCLWRIHAQKAKTSLA